MSTDAGTSLDTALSAELEKAAELLKSKGLNHAAQLLEPESGATPPEPKAAKAQRELGKVPLFSAAHVGAVRKVKAKTQKKVKVKAKTTKAKKTAKTAKTAAPKRKPVSGQSGPRIAELGWDDLNRKEKLVLGAFNIEGDREVRTIEELGAEAFPNQSLKKQSSWTRNSLRRPIRSGIWLEKPEPGKYRLTQAARTKLRA
jgi:hypothetical protein